MLSRTAFFLENMQAFCYDLFIYLDIHVHATICLQILDSLLYVNHLVVLITQTLYNWKFLLADAQAKIISPRICFTH